MPGHLTHPAGELVHPRGHIVADLNFEGDHVRGTASLPDGLQGTLCYAGKTLVLRSGAQSIEL